jgi:DNA-binding XRE family transcriptional regulator
VIVHEVYFAVVDFVVMSKGHPFVKRRKALQLTQADVAKSIGLSTRAIQLWEAGTHEPRLTLGQVVNLCGLLQCTPEDLAADFEEMHNAT